MQKLYIRSDRYAALTPLLAGRETCAPGHSYGPAVRPYWLLHYVFSGTGRYEVNGRAYTLRAGDAFLIKPGEVVRYCADEEDPWIYEWVGFESSLRKLAELPYVIRSDRLSRAVAEADRLFDEGGDICAVSAIWRVISGLCDTLEETETSYSLRAIELIRQQYMQELSVQSLADSLGLDRSYFSRLFKEETGQSPGQYLTEYRMKKALELLECERYAVSVVAASVGYGDVFSFSRGFKRRFGVPPRRFRERKG